MRNPKFSWMIGIAVGTILFIGARHCWPSSLMMSSALLGSTRMRPAIRLNSEQLDKNDVRVGGEQVVELRRKGKKSSSMPEFISATILPGRGMNLLQIKANIPGKGEVDVLTAPTVEQAARTLNNEPETSGGVLSFTFGGAFLVPFANRIRGTLTPDGRNLVTKWKGKTITLPAVWKGKKNPDAELHAIHGLILNRKPDSLNVQRNGQRQTVVGTFHAGNFDGHWVSKTDVTISVTLAADSVEAQIVAKNVGDSEEPMGIGWHPYFAFPSGDREQVKLIVPAKKLAEVNNYDDVFPTGKLSLVAGTKYDFSAPGGRQLGDIFLDDNFSDLNRKGGKVTVDLIDPKASYGLHVQGLTDNIETIQIYAPPDKPFAAIEEQLNYADPFSAVWKGIDTGMVTLQPGQETKWRVRLELFTPSAKR
jgi:aldose 1-epimerase